MEVFDKEKWLRELKRIVEKLHTFSQWLFYTGLVYIGGACTIMVVKTMQFVKIYSMHTIKKGNHVSKEELDKSFELILEDYKEEREENSWLNRLTNDVEDKRAVLMGNAGTL